jgi:hypothetical protein
MHYKTPFTRLKRPKKKIDNWVGKIFDMWEIKEVVRGKKMVICQCINCGEFEKKCPYGLKKYQKHRCNRCIELSFVGKKFGQWTVISPAPKKDKEKMFTCRCSCGNISTRRASSLKKKESTRCQECAFESRRLKINQLDIMGTRLNKILFADIVKDKNRTKLKCICDCGTDFLIDFNFLKYIQGMGCLACSNRSRKKVTNNTIFKKYG